MAAHSDSDDDETLVTLGTPLEVPDADEPVKKPVRVQDIQATDSKGRPRFHGAFTGGFSAGYFNTVGTKEGWTPSTFVSSREKRHDEKPEQRPEHYMDDEDMGEYGIAPRKYVTGAQFSSEERKKRCLDEVHKAKTDAVLPGEYALLELVIPERLTIGVKLLRKMGWKEGQGVGPRLSRKQKQKAGKKLYGCEMPPSPDSCDGLDDESFLSGITYAPQDSALLQLSTKDNAHGLGYKGLDPRKALLSSHVNLFESPRITKGGSSRRGISGQGFGVGAMEDDDEDIYTVDSMSNYDMTMGGDDDSTFGWTGPSGKRQVDTPVGYVGKMLNGFTLSNKKLVQKKDFPPPKLPRDFRPVHTYIHEEDSSSILTTRSTEGVDYRQFLKPSLDTQTTVTSPETPGSSRVERNQYKDASARSVALGEKPFVGSVFDLISQGDKDKMKSVKQGTSQVHGQATSTDLVPVTDIAERKSPAPSVQCSTEEHRQTNVHLLQRAVGFKPFKKNPGKQQRYDKYLENVKLGHKDPYSAMTFSQTEWEIEHEKEEFHTASRLYRPLAAMMAMRFTRAGNVDDDEHANVKVEETGDTSSAGKAAEMKMYGKLTRDVLEWHPDKVVCKRFNVPNPYPGSTIIGLATVKRDKYSVFNFLNFASPTSTEPDQMLETLHQEQSTSSTEQSNTVAPESRADKELNKGKLTKSIFSHLVATEKGTQRSTNPVSFSVKPTKSNKPKEFKSIFSHLENVELVKDVPIGMDTHEKESIPQVENSGRKDEAKILGTKSCEKDGQAGVDLFRAIFRNTDSEDSSEDDTIITKDDFSQPTTDMVVDGADITGGDRLDARLVSELQEDKDIQMGTTTALLGNLPGNGEPMETLGERLSHQPESEDSDSYGPVLPPALDVGSTASSSRPVPPAHVIDLTRQSAADYTELAEHSSRKHKGKHKHKKEKKEKHKKNKHKKKNKKKEKKVRRRHGDMSDETDTTDKDTDDDTATDKEILNKLKSMKAERLMRAVDFL